MSRRAWFYIGFVLLGGITLALVALPTLIQPLDVWIMWLALTTLATLALWFRAIFQTKHESDQGTTAYSPVLALLLAGALLLPPAQMILLVIVSHLIQWAKERWTRSKNLPAWYIQPFNIGMYILIGTAARAVYQLIGAGPIAGSSLLPVVTGVLIILLYLALNSLLIGQVLVLARGVSWAESAVFHRENLFPDLVMLVLGYTVAMVWPHSPWLAAFVLVPLLLLSRAMMVPQLKKEAETDSKTGLANARHLSRVFATELTRADALGRPLTLLMADLDFLRNVNNTYGHLAGDAVLASVGRVIRETVRDHDLAGRFGGEEFAILLPDTTADQGVLIADRLRRMVAATPVPVSTSPTPIFVTMSIGVATFPADAVTQTTLTHAADVAVYQAKLTGRDRVVAFVDVPQSMHLAAMPTAGREFLAGAPAAAAEVLRLYADQLDTAPDAPAVPPLPSLPPSVAEPAPAEPALNGTKPPPAGAAAAGMPPALKAYVGAVILAGVVVSVAGYFLTTRWDLASLVLFMALAAFFEGLQINIYGPATTSASMAAIVAAALLGGVPAVCAASCAIALMHYLRMKPLLYKTAFNWATYLLAGSAVVAVMSLVDLPIRVDNLVWLIVPAAVASMAQYVLNTGLVAGAIALSSGGVIVKIWREQFQWLASHYLVLGMLGLLLALAYDLVGALGALLFVLPIVMIRYAEEQYVERTRDSVQELTRMNRELAQANQEIMNASGAIQQLNDELFMTVARILDARDPYVLGHSAQVASYAVATARSLGLPEARIKIIHQAGLLHDIGKMAIPERILHKPGRLSDEEYEFLKSHAAIGGDFLSSSQTLRHLVPFVRGHHEWWDGRGYPDGLGGDDIPLEARILALCDMVEAMASDRPYKLARSPREIIAEIRRCSGTQFDPLVCDAFIRVVEEHGENFIVNSARAVVQRRTPMPRRPQYEWAPQAVPATFG